MASFMLCPFLLNERCCDCLDLTSMVERVDAGEQEPLSPVHGAKFGMAPDNIQVGIGPGLQQDVESRPLSFTWSRSGECVRNGRDCGQKLLVGFLQCLDELCRSAT